MTCLVAGSIAHPAMADEPLAPLPNGEPPSAAAAAPARAEPPALQATTPPPPPAERKARSYWGVGPTYVASAPTRAGAASADGIGVVLQAGKNYPVAEHADLGFRFAWGLTEWERFPRWGKAGYDAGAWTTKAYSDTYDWTRKNSGAPETHGLRLMGGGFAMIFLWVGYVVSAFCYAFAIVAPTTYAELDFTGTYNFGDGDDGVDPYIKAGAGLIAFVHPDYGVLTGGIGPTLGFGFHVGRLALGANLTWSPPGTHGEARGDDTHLYIGSVTVGLRR